MKALVREAIVAEAPIDAVVGLEGNAYFPPDAIADGTLRDSATPYICPWKGIAQYYDVVAGGTILENGAWTYPKLTQFAIERVGQDFSGYVAFDLRHVRLED